MGGVRCGVCIGLGRVMGGEFGCDLPKIVCTKG